MSSHDMTIPKGGVNMGHVLDTPDPNGNLLEQILSRPNMLNAWKRVKANKGAPGIDKMSVDDFFGLDCEDWDRIARSILDGSYQPFPVLRVRTWGQTLNNRGSTWGQTLN